MRIVPAARKLMDFGLSGPGFAAPAPGKTAPPAAKSPPAAENLEQKLARAFEEGREKGLQDARTAHAARLEELSAAHEEQLARCADECAKKTAARLAGELSQSLAEVEKRISAAVAAILVPFMETAAREKALEELSVLMKSMLRGDEALRIRMSGPPALLEKVRAKLGPAAARAELRPDEEASEISVEVDNTFIETRLGEWMKKIAPGEPR